MITIRPRRPWLARLAGVTAVALTAVGLTACAGPASDSGSGSGTTTVTWWAWNPDATTSKPWIAAFEKAHPNIKVKFRFVQNADYASTVRLALTSGSGPDVFAMQVGAMTDQLAPLAEDLTPYASKSLGSDWKSKLLATDQLATEGKQTGLPWMVTGAGLVWYNKTLFEKAGATPPTTLADWKTACQKITAIGKTCFVQGAKDDWVNLDVYQAIANQLAPGAFYDAISGKGSTKFTSAPFVKAFADWKQLFDDGIIQKGALATTQYPDANDMFNKGDAAMIAFGTWENSNMTKTTLASLAGTYGPDAAKQVYVPIAFPDVVGGAQETGRLFGGPDTGFGVAARSQHKDAAWTLVQWLTTSEQGQKMMGKTLQTPALKTVAVDQSDLVDPAAQAPALVAQGKQIGDLIGARQIADADVQTALGQALSSVASGQSTPSQAAQSVQTAIQSAQQ